MPENHETQLAALDSLLDHDYSATAHLLRKLTPAELQTFADACQALVTMCHDAWTYRLAHLKGDPND
jgi:hypothetical protein